MSSLSLLNAQSGAVTASSSFAPPTPDAGDPSSPRGVATLPALNPELTVHIKASSDKLTEFIVHARAQFRHLCWGIPDAMQLKVSVYGELLQDLPTLSPAPAAHFEVAYFGRCSTLGKVASELLVRFVSDLSVESDRRLILEKMPGCDPKSDAAVLLQPAMAAMAHNTFFTALLSRDIPWDPADAVALGAALRTNTSLLHLTVSRASLSGTVLVLWFISC